MKRSTWFAVALGTLVAFLGGGIVATAILIGPMGMRAPSRVGAIASQSPTVSTTPTASRSPDGNSSLAFDQARGELVAFTGSTWTWNGKSWTLKHPAQSPTGRIGAAMTYDPDHHLVLLWGGFANNIQSADFWAWDGLNWALIQTTDFPPANGTPGWSGPAPILLYDSNRHLVVLIRNNGFHPAAPSGPDVWTWNGTAWTHEAGANVPSIWGTATYDSILGGILFFGVDGNETPRLGATSRACGRSSLRPFFQRCRWTTLHPSPTSLP